MRYLFSHKMQWDLVMKTCYKKLWKLLIDNDMTKTDLCQKTGISTSSLAKLSKGESVTTAVLLRICNVLHCDIGDIVEIVPDAAAQGGENK